MQHNRRQRLSWEFDELSSGYKESSADVTESSNSSTELRTPFMETPTYEFYGFVLYLLSAIAVVFYLVWAYLPDRILQSMGITYYFNRYWAIAVPMHFIVTFCYVLVGIAMLDLISVPRLWSLCTITDEFALVHALKSEDYVGVVSRNFNEEDAIPEIRDLPIALANICCCSRNTGK